MRIRRGSAMLVSEFRSDIWVLGALTCMAIVVQVRFETDDECLEPIEDKLYVGSGRFIVEEGQPIIVEYKISEVAAAYEDRD